MQQQRAVIQDQMGSSLQLSKALTTEKLNPTLSKMLENLGTIERKVQPIAQMSETVRLCKDNINTALEVLNTVTNNISEQEDIIDILVERKAMIESEFDVYIKSMQRCKELIKYFQEDLAYFKDQYSITEKLQNALTVSVEECRVYLEANIKKLLDMSNKKYLKRFKELMKVLEKAATSEQEVRKYLKIYVDYRKSTFKSRLSSANSLDKQVDVSLTQEDGSGQGHRMSILAGTTGASYERGSHPLIPAIVEISTLIEEEVVLAESIFEGKLADYSALSIAANVTEGLISKLATMLSQCESELSKIKITLEDDGTSMRPLLVMMDIIESLHDTMPKSFYTLIKVNELPLKRVLEALLPKTYSILTKVQKIEQEGEMEDLDIGSPIPVVQLHINLLAEVANFPKTYKLLDFVSRQSKQADPKKPRFSPKSLLESCIQLIETRRESFTKKQYSLKYQFILNNYGFIYSLLGDNAQLSKLYGLPITEDSLIGQVQQSLEFHIEQFSQYVWKNISKLLKDVFNSRKGGLSENYQEISEEIYQRMDNILRKDFKKYTIAQEIGASVKLQIKKALMDSLMPDYSKYLKAVKPETSYSVEDVEISVDKMLKIN